MKKFLLIVSLLITYNLTFAQNKADKSKEGYVKARIIDKRGLDGCGYIIELENKEHLQPMNLDKKFQKKNLKVWIKYSVPKKAPVSVCMMGKMIEVTAIEKRKK